MEENRVHSDFNIPQWEASTGYCDECRSPTITLSNDSGTGQICIACATVLATEAELRKIRGFNI